MSLRSSPIREVWEFGPHARPAGDNGNNAVRLFRKEKALSRLDAYTLAGMTMDCGVGEMDAAEKSVHCLVAKSMWTKR
jgi:acetamidase/formamidase